MRWGLGALLAIALAGGCGDDDGRPTPDGDGGSRGCETDADCDDGLFCNGAENCGAAGTCEAGSAPCDATAERCEEETATCLPCDLDGDGHASAECGGDDCDDADPARSPDLEEVCDAAGVDEDCDPATLGRDADGDGHYDPECCDLDDGMMVCGDDCDDTDPDRSPSATEVCDDAHFDEDCDLTTFGRDADADGYDDAACCNLDDTGAMVCGGDCADDDPSRNPGVEEVCDDASVDEDCDPMTVGVDEDGDGYGPPSCCNHDATGAVVCGGDCMDTNADVNPGQTAWFTVDRGDGSFDYDCSGDEEMRYPSTGGCIVLYASCSTFYEGWRYTPVASCGTSGTWIADCISGGEGCVLGSKTQECH